MKTIILNDNSSKSLYGFRSNVIKLAVSLGHRVVCVCPNDGRINDIEKMGAVVEVVNLQRKGSSILNDYKLYKNYVQIFKKYSADLVLNYSIKPNIYGQMACMKLGIKSMCMLTGAGYAFMNNSPTAVIARILYRLTLHKATQVWFLNADDKNDFIRKNYVSSQKAKLIYGEGVDIETFKPVFQNHSPVIFAYVGRMLSDKGVYEFVEAVSQIPNAKGVLVGGVDNGNPSAIAQETIDTWVREKAVEYWGIQHDMAKVYSEISCLVMPSYREGLNMSVMEAMASSLPVIVSNVRGCKDLVNDGENGYICKVKDNERLKEKMEKMLQNNMKEMGKKGRERVEKKYQVSHTNLKYMKLFEEVL